MDLIITAMVQSSVDQLYLIYIGPIHFYKQILERRTKVNRNGNVSLYDGFVLFMVFFFTVFWIRIGNCYTRSFLNSKLDVS